MLDKDNVLVMRFISQCNDLIKDALESFKDSKHSQCKINILQQAISILSSNENVELKLQAFYQKIEENKRLFFKKFDSASEIKKGIMFSSLMPFGIALEKEKSPENFFKIYTQLFPPMVTKEQAFLNAVEEEKQHTSFQSHVY